MKITSKKQIKSPYDLQKRECNFFTALSKLGLIASLSITKDRKDFKWYLTLTSRLRNDDSLRMVQSNFTLDAIYSHGGYSVRGAQKEDQPDS